MREIIKKIKNSIERSGLRITTYKILRNIATYLPPRLYIKFPGYFLRKIFNSKTTVTVNGLRFSLDLRHDQGISRDLYFYRKREFLSTDFVLGSHILNEGDVALDIGANIGYYALLESQLVGDNGFVYALEPVSSNFNSLKENVLLNRLKNIECFHLAAGDKNMLASINVGKNGNLSSFIDSGSFTHKEEVQVVAIDEFLKDKRKPALIRMDVEGFEYAIVEGMRKTLMEDGVRGMLVEIHPHLMPDESLKKMFNTLSDSGFKTASVIFDPVPIWVNSKGKPRPLVKFLMTRIGDEMDLQGGVKHMKLSDLLNFLIKSKHVLHVYLSKEIRVYQ